jgi:hypothetical protein
MTTKGSRVRILLGTSALTIVFLFANSALGVEGGLGGIGPIVTYSTNIGKSHLDFNARWIHDFDVGNHFEGNGFNFSASLKF